MVLVSVDCLLLGVSIAFSIALEPDLSVVWVVFFAVSITLSALGVRQNRSHNTSQTSAAKISSDTRNHNIRPITDTLFCSYIHLTSIRYVRTIAELLQKCNILWLASFGYACLKNVGDAKDYP